MGAGRNGVSRPVEPGEDARHIGRPFAARQPLHQGADRQVGFADAHVVGQGKAAQADVRAVAGIAAHQR